MGACCYSADGANTLSRGPICRIQMKPDGSTTKLTRDARVLLIGFAGWRSPSYTHTRIRSAPRAPVGTPCQPPPGIPCALFCRMKAARVSSTSATSLSIVPYPLAYSKPDVEQGDEGSDESEAARGMADETSTACFPHPISARPMTHTNVILFTCPLLRASEFRATSHVVFDSYSLQNTPLVKRQRGSLSEVPGPPSPPGKAEGGPHHLERLLAHTGIRPDQALECLLRKQAGRSRLARKIESRKVGPP